MTTIKMNNDVKEAFDALQIGDLLNDVFESIEAVSESPKFKCNTHSVKYRNIFGEYYMAPMYWGSNVTMTPNQFINNVIQELTENKLCQLNDLENGQPLSVDEYMENTGYNPECEKERIEFYKSYPTTMHSLGKDGYRKRISEKFNLELMYQPKDLYINVEEHRVGCKRRYEFVKFVCKQDVVCTVGLTYYANFLAFHLLNILIEPDITECLRPDHTLYSDITCDLLHQAVIKFGCST